MTRRTIFASLIGAPVAAALSARHESESRVGTGEMCWAGRYLIGTSTFFHEELRPGDVVREAACPSRRLRVKRVLSACTAELDADYGDGLFRCWFFIERPKRLT